MVCLNQTIVVEIIEGITPDGLANRVEFPVDVVVGAQRCSRSSSAVTVPMRIKLAASFAIFDISTPIHTGLETASEPSGQIATIYDDRAWP
jgi:hypothetical protein